MVIILFNSNIPSCRSSRVLNGIPSLLIYKIYINGYSYLWSTIHYELAVPSLDILIECGLFLTHSYWNCTFYVLPLNIPPIPYDHSFSRLLISILFYLTIYVLVIWISISIYNWFGSPNPIHVTGESGVQTPYRSLISIFILPNASTISLSIISGLLTICGVLHWWHM